MVRALLCILLVPGIASCGSHKSGYVAEGYEYEEEASGDSGSVVEQYDMASVIGSRQEWDDVTISGNMVVGFGSSMKSAVVIRMIRDKSVSISIRPILGIEMGKIYFEGDTVTVVDKYHKAYLQEPIGNVLGDYLNVSTLQSLLLSYPFVVGDGALREDNCGEMDTADGGNGKWLIFPKEQNPLMAYSFDMEGTDLRHFNVAVGNGAEGNAYSVNFGRHEFTGRGTFATMIEANIPLAGNNAYFELSYKSLKWDSGFADAVTIPSGARRYAFKDIIKMISQP